MVIWPFPHAFFEELPTVGTYSNLVHWRKNELRGFPLLLLLLWTSGEQPGLSISHAGPSNALTHVFWQKVKNKRWWCLQRAAVWAGWLSNAVQFENCCCVTHPPSIKKTLSVTLNLWGHVEFQINLISISKLESSSLWMGCNLCFLVLNSCIFFPLSTDIAAT